MNLPGVHIVVKLYIFSGGRDSNGELDTTELFQNGFFTPGPRMPEAFEGGSAVMYNITHVFVASNSNRNWFLDIDTWTWTEIAERVIEPISDFHISGTYFDPTRDETAIGNIGHYGIQVYHPSLDRWTRQLSPLFISNYGTQKLQMSSDYFLFIGGYEFGGMNGNNLTSATYRFDHNGATLIEEDSLDMARAWHVAITINADQVNCF